MSTAGTITTREALTESQRDALVKLLGDEDQAIYQTIREKILSCGPQATEWLRLHTLSREPVLRRRALEIVRYFERQAADNRFLAFCLQHGEEFDLEEAAWLLAQTQYPEINVEAYRAMLDSYAGDLKERIDFTSGAKQILTTINHYLFQELGFVGNSENYYDPENSYLNRVVDRRTGNPIALCLLYMLVARRLRLAVVGIGLPGHFVCRHQASASELYIDAFNRGAFLAKADCIQYLVKANYGVREQFLMPQSPRKVMSRMCENLHQIYQQMEMAEEATRLQRYSVALSR